MFGHGTDVDALPERTLIATFAHITELTAPRSDLVARFHLLIVARAPTRPLGAAPSRFGLRGAKTPNIESMLERLISSAATRDPFTHPATRALPRPRPTRATRLEGRPDDGVRGLMDCSFEPTQVLNLPSAFRDLDSPSPSG